MTLIVVGIVLISFTIAVFLVARTDWNEDVSDISPFPEEVQMVELIQKLSKIVTILLSCVAIGLGVCMVFRGLTQVF